MVEESYQVNCYKAKGNIYVTNPKTGEILMIFGSIEICTENDGNQFIMKCKQPIIWKNSDLTAWSRMKEFYEYYISNTLPQ